MSSSWERDLLP